MENQRKGQSAKRHLAQIGPMKDKVINNELDAKKIWVHIEDPNNSTSNESGTPTA
jgi:hypothetical protein